MSGDDETQLDVLRSEVAAFLQKNFPQIRTHGGQAAITDLNVEEKSVAIELGGACDGCGLSPMTIAAVQRRIASEIDGIDHVSVGTDLDAVRAGNNPSVSDAPF